MVVTHNVRFSNRENEEWQTTRLRGSHCGLTVTFVLFLWCKLVPVCYNYMYVEHNGSGVELRALNYENSGLNPVLQC